MVNLNDGEERVRRGPSPGFQIAGLRGLNGFDIEDILPTAAGLLLIPSGLLHTTVIVADAK